MKIVEQIIENMHAKVEAQRHCYIVPEHLLLSIAESHEFRKSMPLCDWRKIAGELEDFLSKNIPCGRERIVSPELRRLLEGCESRSESKSSTTARLKRKSFLLTPLRIPSDLTPLELLKRFFTLEDSHARYILEKNGIFADTIEIFREESIEAEIRDKEDSVTAEDFLVNLNELVKAGKIDPLIGRNIELEKLIRTLSRRQKNNPVLVGEPGTGKTAIVEGLARKIVYNEVPSVLKNCEIFSLVMGALIAGTNYRGDFEKRLKEVIDFLKDKPSAILFIDEIHTVIGAGTCEGNQLDASNILKPALARGQIRCIGATTYEDYKRMLSRDRAFLRRLQKIDVKEPSETECVEIIKGILPEYERHHGVKYDISAVEAAVSLSAKYIHGKFLPDKAIDLIDEAGAKVRISECPGTKRIISESDIEAIISSLANIPPKTVCKDETEVLKNLSGKIKQFVYGQDEAVDKVVKAIKISRAGFGNPNKPIASFLFCGKTGVGKTELAKQLASALGISFVKFDMSEFSTKETVSKLIGTSPGYVGFEQAGMLTDAIIKEQHCVLLLDEIEKADPAIYNLLLQVMDAGTLTENSGRKADFRNVILIMTSNVGAFEAGKNSIGFNRDEQIDRISAIGGALKRSFSPEFRNRLDGIIFFNDLSLEMLEKVVRKIILRTNDALAAKNVTIVANDSAVRWISEKAMEENLGARPVERIIIREIKEKIVDEILFGGLKHGGKVLVSTDKDGIVLKLADGRKIKNEAA